MPPEEAAQQAAPLALRVSRVAALVSWVIFVAGLSPRSHIAGATTLVRSVGYLGSALSTAVLLFALVLRRPVLSQNRGRSIAWHLAACGWLPTVMLMVTTPSAEGAVVFLVLWEVAVPTLMILEGRDAWRRHRRAPATAISPLRRIVVAPLVVLAVLLAGMLFALVFNSWDDWAAELVYRAKEPLVIGLVNATPEAIREFEFGLGGDRCHVHSLQPGGRVSCTPKYRGGSGVYLWRRDLAGSQPRTTHSEELPVNVTWRTHGEIEIIVTDAGVEIDGGFSDELF